MCVCVCFCFFWGGGGGKGERFDLIYNVLLVINRCDTGPHCPVRCNPIKNTYKHTYVSFYQNHIMSVRHFFNNGPSLVF